MREGWRETTLGEVAEIIIGRTPPRNTSRFWTTDLARPFCTIADMTADQVSPQREGVTEAAEREGKARRVPAGALLMSFKLTLGRVGFAKVDLFPNEAIAWLRPLPPDVDDRYLANSLSSMDLEGLAGRAVKGRTLNGPSLKAIPILLPPLDEQRRIVDLIAAVDEAIEAAGAVKGAADQARHGLLGELLSEERAEREGWLETTLGEVADVVRGVSWSKDRETWSPEPSAVPVVRIGNVQLSGIDMRECLFVRAVSMRDLKAKAITPDTILMVGSNGNRERVGNVYAANSTLVGHLFASFIIGIRVSSGVSAAYVWRWLQQRRTQAAITEATAGSTGLKNLSLIWLRNLPILLPPLDEQRRVVDIISAVDDQAAIAASLMTALRTLRSALLADLLSGDHEVPDSYDEVLTA